jgi:hypothetical protein
MTLVAQVQSTQSRQITTYFVPPKYTQRTASFIEYSPLLFACQAELPVSTSFFCFEIGLGR